MLGCRQPSKSDQVTDLSEKAYLHEVIQVPELNETYLCEGKLKNKDSVSQLRILSNMMEEETHVDSTSSGILVFYSSGILRPSDRRLMMDTFYTPLTFKLISLLFLDSKPPNSLDTLMNVWCLGWISKIRSREGISLILSTFKFYLQNAGLPTWWN